MIMTFISDEEFTSKWVSSSNAVLPTVISKTPPSLLRPKPKAFEKRFNSTKDAFRRCECSRNSFSRIKIEKKIDKQQLYQLL